MQCCYAYLLYWGNKIDSKQSLATTPLRHKKERNNRNGFCSLRFTARITPRKSPSRKISLVETPIRAIGSYLPRTPFWGRPTATAAL
jgi:hypothetical protein